MAQVTETERDSPTLEARCGAAVDALLARRGWRLLPREELMRRALDHLRSGVASDPTRAATHAYSAALHAACSGAEGAARRELGYGELFRYLYDSAHKRYPDVADDATQRALVGIYAGFGRCRQPGTFLAFAFQHLMDAARATRRQEARGGQSLATPIGENGEDTLAEVLPDPRQIDPALETIERERRERLALHAEAFVRRHPRARLQFFALWLKFIDGLDDVTIGHRLGKPVSSVYVLRSRALEKLQTDPDWRAFAIDCGIIPPDPPGPVGAGDPAAAQRTSL